MNTGRMTDFSEESIFLGTVTKLNPKTKEEAGERFFEWSIEVSSEVDYDSIQQLESSMPGSMRYHSRAVNGQTDTTISVKPVERRILVEFWDQASSAMVCSANADVLSVKLNVNEKAQSFVGKLKASHLDLEQSSALLDCLGREMVVTVKPSQQTLFRKDPLPKVGGVVTCSDRGVTRYGIVKSTNERTFILDDFGNTFEADNFTVCLDLEINEPSTRMYLDECNFNGGKPSWRYLITAIMSFDRSEDINYVGDDIVNLALKLQFGSGE